MIKAHPEIKFSDNNIYNSTKNNGERYLKILAKFL
jgi:hypothetical protein